MLPYDKKMLHTARKSRGRGYTIQGPAIQLMDSLAGILARMARQLVVGFCAWNRCTRDSAVDQIGHVVSVSGSEAIVRLTCTHVAKPGRYLRHSREVRRDSYGHFVTDRILERNLRKHSNDE